MRPSVEQMNKAWELGYTEFMSRFGHLKRYQWPYVIKAQEKFDDVALQGNFDKGWNDAINVCIQQSRNDATKNRVREWFQ